MNDKLKTLVATSNDLISGMNEIISEMPDKSIRSNMLSG